MSGRDAQAHAPFIVAVSGSPSPQSKTAQLAQHILERLQPNQSRAAHIRIADIDAAALLRGDLSHHAVEHAFELIAQADGLIVATPIFKASFSGLLKSFLDLLPQFALAGKCILPLATGGSPAHVLALDYGLRPVLQSMGARHIVQSIFIGSSQMAQSDSGFDLEDSAQTMISEAILHFRFAMRIAPETPSLLGHPRPDRGALSSQSEVINAA